MSEDIKSVGFSPMVLFDSLSKRLADGVAGRGGLEAFCQFFDQIDWVQGLAPLRQSIKEKTVHFEAALSKCVKEMLKRPLGIRENEVFDLLGATCPKCGFKTTLWRMLDTDSKCPKCDGTLTPTYVLIAEELVAKKIEASPEVVLMYGAYDWLAQAYIDAYKAFRMVLEAFAQLLGWERFRVGDQRLRNYLDEFFLGRFAGEQKIAREEKECLQFLVRGNLAVIPVEEAEKLLRLGLSVVKFGYLFQVLGASGAKPHYYETLTSYNILYDQLNAQIRKSISQLYGEVAARKFVLKKSLGGYYPPCFLVPKNTWQAGQLSGEILLEPIYRLPIFPKADFGALQAVYGRLGAGKTFLLSSIICYSILAKRETVIVPLNDKTNSFSLSVMPLFAYDKHTEKLVHMLEQVLEVEPQGVPCLTITVLRKNEKVYDEEAHPPTVFDRVMKVDNSQSFRIDFDELMDALKETAEIYGYSQPVGIITFRNLDRYYRDKNINVDVQVATNVLSEFDRWRRGHLERPSRVVIDEVSYLAASQVVLYAGDALRAGATISDFIKESRRNRVSVDCATQMPVEIVPELRNASTNIFFRDLAISRDKMRSQIDYLLGSLQLSDDYLNEVLAEMNKRGALPKGFWFWFHQPKHAIQLIRPCPPTFMLYDLNRSPKSLYKLYEKRFGQKILLESWKEVKELKQFKSKTDVKTQNL